MKSHAGLILPDVSAVMRTASEYLESIRDGRRILFDYDEYARDDAEGITA
jgi:hypothetical protein